MPAGTPGRQPAGEHGGEAVLAHPRMTAPGARAEQRVQRVRAQPAGDEQRQPGDRAARRPASARCRRACRTARRRRPRSRGRGTARARARRRRARTRATRRLPRPRPSAAASDGLTPASVTAAKPAAITSASRARRTKARRRSRFTEEITAPAMGGYSCLKLLRDGRGRPDLCDRTRAAVRPAADPALPAGDHRRARPRRRRRLAAGAVHDRRHRSRRALPELRQGAGHLLPGDRLRRDDAQLDEQAPRSASPSSSSTTGWSACSRSSSPASARCC